MTIRTNAPTMLENPPIPVQAKIAAAWTSFMFLYAYVDILNFYKPGAIDSILNGLMFEYEVSATIVTSVLVAVSIPAVMVVLSMMLPARVNRAMNLVMAFLYIPFTAFNATGETWEWAGFYGIAIGIEVLLLTVILRAAWTWPRIAAVPGGGATTDLRQDVRQ